MRAFFDVEYLIRHKKPKFVSIGIVRDDGAELHRVTSDFDPHDIRADEWFFKKKVWAKIKDHPRVPRQQINEEVRQFLQPVTLIATREGGFDRRILAQLIGKNLLGIRFCDIQQVWLGLGQPPLPKREDRQIHHACDDARWHMMLLNSLSIPTMSAA